MKETKFKQTEACQTKDERRETKESTRHCEERSDVAIQGDFKMTEVGLIPNDWGVKKIGELCSITTGSQNTQDHKEDGKYPFFVRSQEVERIDKYIFDTEGVVTAGDGVGTGKIFHYVNGKFGLHQRCYLMYEFDRNISAKYFYWIFSVNFYDRVHSMTAKSSVDSVRREMIADMPIALPPIKEQQRIANALSDIDTLIANLEKLIAKKKNIKQGAMQQLLTGKKRLPGFGGKWNKKVISKLGYTYNGLSGKIASDFGKGSAQYITFLNVLNNPVVDKHLFQKVNVSEAENQNKVLKDDLLFNTSSEVPEEVGICSVLKAEVPNLYLNSFCFGFRLTDTAVDGLFLSYYFRSPLGRSLMSLLAQGSTRYNLSKDNFLKSSIVIPSSKTEQTAIANVLSDMDTEISALETKLAKYRTLKTGMMQQLLTGKIRLV